VPFIVEDLGIITPDVQSLRDQFQLPGTRVLQFAFDGNSDNPYLPRNFVTNTVAYTGTHDNPPTREWYDELPDYQRQNFWSYLNRAPGGSSDAASALIGLAWSSKAALAIAPLQDVLNLGAESRMNVPGRAAGNWRWRVQQEALSGSALEWLREVTISSSRVEMPDEQVDSPSDNSIPTTPPLDPTGPQATVLPQAPVLGKL
jgi:4-alpha-glucanotransferase